jgi:hypothetical protein
VEKDLGITTGMLYHWKKELNKKAEATAFTETCS